MITFSPEIRYRCDLALLCNRRGLVGPAAEIGVHQGHFAQAFLALWKGDTYHAVDPYLACEQMQHARTIDYEIASGRLARFGGRVKWEDCDGTLWLEAREVDSLDCVYIDADHDYFAVRDQIAAAWPKLKAGGMLAGHDFSECFPDVVRAVCEFSRSERVDVQITSDAGVPWSWFAFRPEAPCA